MSTPQAQGQDTPAAATTVTNTETDPSTPNAHLQQHHDETQDDYPDEYPFEYHYTHTDEHPEHDDEDTIAAQAQGFINAHNTDLKEHIRPTATEELVEYLWRRILARVKLDLDLEKEDANGEKSDAGRDLEDADASRSTTEDRRKGSGKKRKARSGGKQRRFEVRTTKLQTPYSEKHFAVLGSVARRRIRRKHKTTLNDGQVMPTQAVEKQEKIVLLVEPRSGPMTQDVLGSKDGLERWWDGMLMPRFEETVCENWDGVLGRDRDGVSVVLAAGAGVRVFWAERVEDGEEDGDEDEDEGVKRKVKVRLVRAHGKSVLDLREGGDQDVVEGLLRGVLERAWEDDGRAPWEGVQGEGRSMERSLMYRPVV